MLHLASFAALVVLALPASAQNTLFTLDGENPSGFPGFGHSVSGGGDVNADGVPDLIVGAPYENAFGGQAKVYSGVDGALLLTLQSPQGGRYGNSVDIVGDVNSDGYADLLVGAEEFTIFNLCPGYAELRSGLDGAVLFHWDGLPGRGHFGDAVAGAGDVNADGFDDVLVSAHITSPGGKAWLYSGRDGSVLFEIGNSIAGDRMGESLHGAGDSDNDGYDDFIIGSDQFSNSGPGKAGVYSGKPSLLGSVSTLSLSSGGSLDFELSAGAGNANNVHWMFGSMTGFAPGTMLLGVSVPLVVDSYFLQTLNTPFSGIFSNDLGFLDANGDAQAAVTLPPGSAGTLAGTNVWHAYLAAPGIAGPIFVSNPVLVELVP